jgi:fatty-acid desaturase
MKLTTKLISLQAFNHVITVPAIAYAVYTQQYTYLWIALAVWFVIGPVSSVITLHRLLTHRSFETYAWLEKTLSYISVISTVGPTINWVAVHRQHHAKSDREGDPHSPYANGKFSLTEAAKIWLGYDWKIPNIPIKFVKDLIRNPTHKFIFNNYFKIIFAYCVVLLAIDPMLFLFAYVVPASVTMHLIGVVNILGHYHGYRNHETKDHSSNSWIANIVSLGEGWHNNHHAKPANYHTGEKWWEWDLMGSLIKLIKIN